VQERLPPEHGGELHGHPFEHLLDGGRVADERARHLEAPGRYVAHGRLGVVRYPLDEVTRVFRLHVEHLLVHLLHGRAAAEYTRGGQVPAVPGVARGHHVLGVEHLLDELRHGQRPVRLTAAGRERREPGDEEVQPRERHHVDRQLPEVGVQLSGKPEARGHAAHDRRHQMVQIAVRGRVQLQRPETNVVQRLVVDAVRLVGVLYQLVHGQRHVIRFHDGVGYLYNASINFRVDISLFILFHVRLVYV